MRTPDTGKIISFAYIAALIIILFVVYKIMAGLGLIKTSAKKKEAAAEAAAETLLREMKFFDPSFLKGKLDGYTSLKAALASRYADEIRTAIKKPGTDEEKVYSVFASLPCRYAISEVSLNYKVNYSRDLRADLLNDLNDGEKLILVTIINKLPEKI